MREVPLIFLASGCLWIGPAEHEARKTDLAIEFEVADVNPDAWSLCEGEVPSFAVAGSVAGRHAGASFDAWVEVEGEGRVDIGQVTADPADQGRSTLTFQVELDGSDAVAACADQCTVPMKVGVSRLGLEGEVDAQITVVGAAEPELVSARFTSAQGVLPVADVVLQDNPADSIDTSVWTDLVLEIADPHQALELGGTGAVVACPVGLDPVGDASSCVEAPAEAIAGTDGDGAFRAPTAALGQAACEPGMTDVRWALYGRIDDHACGGPYVLPLDLPPLRLVSGDCDGDGHTVADGDCDDDDPARHPGVEEVWYDGVDSDCGGGSDYDRDGDSVDADTQGGTDCDDDDPSRYPGADEICDGRDNDCDAQLLTNSATLYTKGGTLQYPTISDAIGVATGGDEIAICPGVYHEALQIDASLTVRGVGDLPGDTTIEPLVPGAAGITIQGSGHDVTLENLRVTGAMGVDGGGVDARGAGILSVTSCEIEGNSATVGGGLLVTGTVTITDTLVAANTADDGGGIATTGIASVQLAGTTTVSGNAASITGGGVFATACNLQLDDTVVVNGNSAFAGGGIALVGAGNLTGGVVEANAADEGAGVALVQGAVPPVFTITDTVIRDHDLGANFRGGGIHARGDGIELTLDGARLARNAVIGDGGGIFIEGTVADPAVLTMSDDTLEENVAGNQGGGVYALDAEIELDDETFTANQAIDGAGMYLDRVVADLRAVVFDANDADSLGGGIAGLELDLTARDVDFDQNLAQRGGAVLLDVSTAEFTNGSWTGNDASSYGGGAVLRNASELVWTGTLVGTGNLSEGAYIEGGTLYGCDLVDVDDELVPAAGGGTSLNPNNIGCFQVDELSFSQGSCAALPPC